MSVWNYIASIGSGAVGGAGMFRWWGAAALEKYKAKLSQELEGWKAGYQKSLDENRVRFTRLHADRANVIRQLFLLLLAMEEAVGAAVNPNPCATHSETLKRDARIAFENFSRYFTQNRIFLSTKDCESIELLRETAKEAFQDHENRNGLPTSEGGENTNRKPYSTMVNQFPELRKKLEQEFRIAMGFDESDTAKEAVS